MNLFWRQTLVAYLGAQGRHGTIFPTGAPQVCDFDLVRVELQQRDGGGRCQMNPDTRPPKAVAPWPPQRLKPSLCLFVLICFVLLSSIQLYG